ncbi:hypothetical protein V8C86DRAFT_607092 [Haematococcus lacustris]
MSRAGTGQPHSAQDLLNNGGNSSTSQHPRSTSSSGPGSSASGQQQQLLESLPLEELEKLLSDDDAFSKFAATWVSYSPAAQTLSQLQQRNLELARSNLDMQASLEEVRNQIAIVRNSEYAAVKAVFQELVDRQSAVLKVLAPTALLDRLRQDVDQLNDGGSSLMDGLMVGQLSVEQFVEQYTAQRVQYYSLDLKRQAAELSLR